MYCKCICLLNCFKHFGFFFPQIVEILENVLIEIYTGPYSYIYRINIHEHTLFFGDKVMDAGYFRTIKWLIHVLQSFSLMVKSGIIIN